MIYENAKNLEVTRTVDVIVGGGGVAGVAAAVAAARTGARVLVIEKDGTLGGNATSGLTTQFVGVDRSVQSGIFIEMLDRLAARKAIVEGFFAPFDPEALKLVLLEMLLETEVDILFHTWIASAVVEKGTVKGAIIESKSGRQGVMGGVTVDTTGDGDIAFRAGAEFEKGQPGSGWMQPATVLFRMGNVDGMRLAKYIEENPAEFYSWDYQREVDSNRVPPFIAVSGFFNLIKKAKDKGDLFLNHESLWMNSMPIEGQFLINATRVTEVDGTDNSSLSKAEISARRQAESTREFLIKYMPGFERAYLLDTGASIGVRETRRIKGDRTLTEKEIMDRAKSRETVVNSASPIDIHAPEGNPQGHVWNVFPAGTWYDIPYGCLIPSSIERVLTGGRCISATAEAHASIRLMPCCVSTGQAAGVAAALAVRHKVPPRLLDVGALQAELVKLDMLKRIPQR
jgi:hypothetical protein